MNNTICEEDIVMLNKVFVGPYQNGYVNKPLTVFGKQALGFIENGEFLNVIINTEIDAGAKMDKINELLDFVYDCRDELERFYFSNCSEWINDENRDMVKNEWYDTLEVFSGMIEIPKDGELTIEFMCGDCIFKEEVFYLTYTKSKGFVMWFDD